MERLCTGLSGSAERFCDLKDNDYKKDGSALQTLADHLQKAYDALCGYGAYEALDSAVSRVKTVVAAGKDGYYAADKYQHWSRLDRSVGYRLHQ